MALFKRGMIPWNKGKTKKIGIIVCACGCGLTVERYNKYGRERRFINHHHLRGWIPSEQTRKLWSLQRREKHGSPKTEFQKGIVPWMKGRKHTEETKKKLSLARAGVPTGRKPPPKFLAYRTPKGRKPWNLGLRWSKEIREKMSRSQREKRGQFTPVREAVRNSLPYIEHRAKIMMRDGFACVQCGAKGRIEMHHKNKLANVLRENNLRTFEDAIKHPAVLDENNVITLCVSCHKKTENYGNSKTIGLANNPLLKYKGKQSLIP